MGNFTVLDFAKVSPAATQALRRPAEVAGAAHQRGTRHDAARAASVVDDADRRRVGAAVHEVSLARAPRGLLRCAAGAHGRACSSLPIAAGLVGTLLPAFGYLPAIGGTAFDLDAWRGSSRIRALRRSVAVTLVDRRADVDRSRCRWRLRWLLRARARPAVDAPRRRRGWRPSSSTPHSAIAIGFAFLIAPSGWIVRAISPWLTGWTLPPDVATVGDPRGTRAGRWACC